MALEGIVCRLSGPWCKKDDKKQIISGDILNEESPLQAFVWNLNSVGIKRALNW